MDPIVITVATSTNQYVDEFEYQVKKLGYHYFILGRGMEWKGWTMRSNLYIMKLRELSDHIVIICDCYDLLFIQKADTLLDKYNQLATGKIVIGLENMRDMFCEMSPICYDYTVKKCKIDNKFLPTYNYPNAGFIMGSANEVVKIYEFMINSNIKDDQLSLYKWIYENCDKCYFDYRADFVFNYFIKLPFLVDKHPNIEFLNETKEILIGGVSKPGVVHIPAQHFDLGHRSEHIRNFIISGRNQKKVIEYFKESYNKSCSEDFCYAGYWWWIILILLIIIIIVPIKYGR